MESGEEVDKGQIAKKVIIDSGGIAKTADFINEGMAKYEISSLCKDGLISKVRHGYYTLPDEGYISEAQLLSKLIPEGIICMESALFHYGYSDFTPRAWTVAVPRTIGRSKLKIDMLTLKVYYIKNELHQLGKAFAIIDGIEVAIYDRERTICDCFKYRTKMDSEIFNKAINAYVADNSKNLGNLSKYAKEMHLFKKVSELIEVMLNG
jgi:predicted transcriptional regulator of viral defense system